MQIFTIIGKNDGLKNQQVKQNPNLLLHVQTLQHIYSLALKVLKTIHLQNHYC